MNNILKNIISRLKNENFIVHMYQDSEGTYLKIDYGICDTIRFGEYHSNDYFRYRYNVIRDCSMFRKELVKDNIERFFYPPTDIDHLIHDIVLYRNNKVDKYSEKGYKKILEQSKLQAINDKTNTFWLNAHEVY